MYTAGNLNKMGSNKPGRKTVQIGSLYLPWDKIQGPLTQEMHALYIHITYYDAPIWKHPCWLLTSNYNCNCFKNTLFPISYHTISVFKGYQAQNDSAYSIGATCPCFHLPLPFVVSIMVMI